MKKRSKTATVHVSTRMREPLRAKLEKAAKAGKVSLNNELVARVERSFSEDDAFGGSELRQIAYLMASAFAIAGKASACGKPPKEWLQDPGHYGTAVMAVVDALMIGRPDEFKRQVINMLGAKLAYGLPSKESRK